VKEIQAQLKDIKKDLEDLKAAVEKMDRNGLRMRPAF
jgi:chromosome segregation ATPase